jgi:signal transduction histidine kinase/CheY-like chemotaxis protein
VTINYFQQVIIDHLIRFFQHIVFVGIILSSLQLKAQLTLDNIQELKNIYEEWEWQKADSSFHAQVRIVKDSTLKQALYLDWGTYLTEQHDYTWAEIVLNRARDLAEYNEDVRGEAEASYQLGTVYFYVNIPLQSQQYYQDALDGFIFARDTAGIARCYDGIADNHRSMSDFESAMVFYQKCDTLFRLLNDRESLSNIYGNIGDMVLYSGYPDSAEQYIQKALDIDLEFGFTSNRVSHTLSLAQIASERGNTNQSYEYYHKALKLSEESENPLDLGFTNEYLGYYHIEQGNDDSAKYYMVKTLEVANRLNSSQLRANAANVLHQVHAARGQYDSAYNYLYYYSKSLDTLFSDNNIIGLAELRTKYHIAQSEAEKQLLRREAELSEIQLQKQEITNYFLAFAAFIFLLAFGWVYYYAIQRRKINKQLRKDRDTIKEQAERLEEMDQYKSRFFANISHDFRTPLSLIVGYVDILKLDYENLSDTSKQAMGHIDESVNRLTDMTEEIRDLIRLQEKRIHLKYVKIHVNAFFGMLADMFKVAAANRGLELTFKSEVPWDVIIHADKYAIEKIVFNLVDNAMKYNTTGKKIDFNILHLADGIKIEICDDGAGIKAEKLPLVFERFYQSNENAHHLIEGQGIGLNVVKEYIELHGGKVAVTSEPNVRTCFSFDLPFNHDKELQDEQVVGNLLDEQLKKVLNKRKISLGYHKEEKVNPDKEMNYSSSDAEPMVLLVDDHPGIREYLRQILDDEYLILEASSGDEALYILETTADIAIVISDMMMPKMSGQELVEKMRGNARTENLPIIGISANKEMEEQLAYLKESNFQFISKPFDAEHILSLISEMIYSTRQL